LLFFTLLIVVVTIFKNRHTTPGAIHWENPLKHCGLERFYNYSSIWLLCEGNDGFVIAHWMHPFTLTYYWGLPGFVAWLAFYFEAGEAFTSSNFHSFVFTQNNVVTQETLPGSIIGDAAINGMGAVLLAIAASQFTNWNGVFGHGRRMSFSAYVKYVLIGLPFTLLFIAAPMATGDFRWGIFLILMVDLFLISVWVPFWIAKDDVPGYDLFKEYIRAIPLFVITLTILAVSELLPLAMANPWYQTWTAAFGMLFIYKALTLCGFSCGYSRGVSETVRDNKSGMRETRNSPNAIAM
jgi:hypothetical protein